MEQHRVVIEDRDVFVQSKVLRGRVKRKPVCLSLTPATEAEAGTAPVVSLRIGSKAAPIVLDPRSLLVTVDSGRFHEVVTGRIYNSTSSTELELFYVDLATEDAHIARLCFESRSAQTRWHEAIETELYKGNSLHKGIRKGAEDDVDLSGSMWESFLHINGMSVFTEKEREGEPSSHRKSDTSMMSSVVIRNSPKNCLKVLLKESLSFDSSRDPRIGGALAFCDSLEVIKHVDRNSSLVRMRWSCAAAGMAFPMLQSVVWPREAVLLRTWRKSDDGTYVVVYQPTNGGTRRYTVSKGCVEAEAVFGFTIAPLLEEYYAGDCRQTSSPESLVTLVIKADVGGVAASNNFLSRVWPELHRKLVIGILRPIIMSLVLMRDRLEQSRFVVMPSMFSQEDEDDALDDWVDVSESSARLEKRGRFVSSVSSVLRRITPVASLKTLAVMPEATAATGTTAATKVTDTPEAVAMTPTTPVVYSQLGSTDPKFWSYPGYDYLKIRGKSYLDDRVKVRAAKPVFELYSSDLVDSERVLLNIAEDLPSVQYCDAPYAFVLNLVFPNKPLQNLVTTWTCPVDPTEHTIDELVEMQCFTEGRDGETASSSPPESSASPSSPSSPSSSPSSSSSLRAFWTNYMAWIQGDEPADDERRNRKFKLIPRIARGSWVIKQAVGTTPVLLGQKLETRYFRGRTARGCNYFEVDVDITSNPVANNITRLVVNSITSLVVDLAPLVEGQEVDELPERLIGSVRYNHLDLRRGSKFGEGGGLAPRDDGNHHQDG